MSRSLKIRLERFRELTEEQQSQALHKLIDIGKGPLRIREKVLGDGQTMIYLGPRTWSQYFLEKLALFPAEKEERRQATRDAIEKYIQPQLKIKKGNAYNVDLIDKLHYRVYNRSVRGSSYYREKPKNLSEASIGDTTYRFESRTAVAGTTTVPKGLSIARIAPAKVVADARIMGRETENERGLFGGACQNIVSDGYIDADPLHGCNSNNVHNHYRKQLEAANIPSRRSIVLELQNDDKAHWRAAYSAAHALIKETLKKHNVSLSIMLVPPSDETGEIQGQEMSRDQWLTTIAGYLKEAASTPEKTPPVASSGVQRGASRKAAKRKVDESPGDSLLIGSDDD